MYKIFSVDDHIVEPADLWISRLPSKYHDTAPHVVEEDSSTDLAAWVDVEEALTLDLLSAARHALTQLHHGLIPDPDTHP